MNVVLSDDPFSKEHVFLPKDTVEKLKKISREKQLPVSRLIAIAVDNEFEVENPFNYVTEMPFTDYEENMYLKEANLILDFLTKHPRGLNLQGLLLCRYQIGIPDKDVFLHGFRELLLGDKLLNCPPHHFSGYGKDYPTFRIKDYEKYIDKKRKFKSFEGENLKHVRYVKDDTDGK